PGRGRPRACRRRASTIRSVAFTDSTDLRRSDRVGSHTVDSVDLAELQDLKARTYGEQDAARGVPATIAWITEEIGELAQAVRKGDRADQVHELGDVLAWLASLANQLGIALDE